MKYPIVVFLKTCLLIAVFISSQAIAESQKWRRISVNSTQATQGIHAPVIDDIAVSKNNKVYIVGSNHKLSKLEGEIWVSADGRKATTYRDKDGYFRLPKILGSGSAATSTVLKLKEPDRMNGIAARVAVDSAGNLWVVTRWGHIYQLTSANEWVKISVMGSDIVTGPDGQVAIWSMHPLSDEHKSWMKKNPYPMVLEGKSWKNIKSFKDLKSIAYDDKGGMWVLSGKYNQPKQSKLMRKLNKKWEQVSGIPNLRHIESDPHGNLWALSFVTRDKATRRGIKTTNERLYHWSGKEWVDDKSIKNLHVSLRTKPPYFGSLFNFRGNQTWASKQNWFSLFQMTAEEIAKDKKKKKAATANKPITESKKVFTVANTKWYGIIEVLNDSIPIDPTIKKSWAKGAYLHMREDGSVGYNFQKPKDYTYVAGNRWEEDGGELIIYMGPVGYLFKLKQDNKNLVANINNIFRMTIDIR